MQWLGCYQADPTRSYSFQNSLPRPEGYTSTACAAVCRGYKYIMLQDGGRCACLDDKPYSVQVDDQKCGEICETEQDLLPARRCGTKSGSSVFWRESVDEVRKDMASNNEKRAAVAEDIWPAWPEVRRSSNWAGIGGKGKKEIVKGISYGPVPLRSKGRVPDDDFMAIEAKGLWERHGGRNDLAIIKALGANVVRLYGNDPSMDHSSFLDAAMTNGLEVIAGISDYPYTQSPHNCLRTDNDCYEQVKEQYMDNLRKGFLTIGNSYHPALRTMILMNEPDLKFPGGYKSFCKALVSALDAALDAEKAVGVAGEAVAFTVTFSFGVCHSCKDLGYKPAIGQMLALRDAMKDPESVGYKPRNDLWKAYQARFINSMNTANPAYDIRRMFLNDYDNHFPKTPVFIGEYHTPRLLDQQHDLEAILDIARNETTMLEGISFFEFQVRYDKGGSEMSFGMFGLKEKSVTDLEIKGREFDVYCLKPMLVSDVTDHMYKNVCGPIEVGVDYVTDGSWSLNLDHLPSANICCEKCQGEPKCKAWTWIEDAKVQNGIPTQCWLKGGEITGKLAKNGFISGMPKAGLTHHDKEFVEDGVASLQKGELVQTEYGQCGGQFWDGPSRCPKGFQCRHRSETYAQCLPHDFGDEEITVDGQRDSETPNLFIHAAVAAAFGGPGVEPHDMCPSEEEVTTTKPALPPVSSDDFKDTTAAPTTEAPTPSSSKPSTWYGCYMQGAGGSYVFSNEQGGYTSETCSDACDGYKYGLLHNYGHCSCASSEPEDSQFTLVDDVLCGEACPGESSNRYCGALTTFAVYKLG